MLPKNLKKSKMKRESGKELLPSHLNSSAWFTWTGCSSSLKWEPFIKKAKNCVKKWECPKILSRLFSADSSLLAIETKKKKLSMSKTLCLLINWSATFWFLPCSMVILKLMLPLLSQTWKLSLEGTHLYFENLSINNLYIDSLNIWMKLELFRKREKKKVLKKLLLFWRLPWSSNPLSQRNSENNEIVNIILCCKFLKSNQHMFL